MSLSGTGQLDITINGAGAITGSGANNQVTLWTGTTTIAGDTGFVWSGTGASMEVGIANRLVIGDRLAADTLKNTLIGPASGGALTGTGNIAIGYNAGRSIATGIDNVAIGWNALNGNAATSATVCIGRDTLQQITTSSFPTAVGHEAFQDAITLIRSTALGAAAGTSVASAEFTDCTFVGYGTSHTQVTASNTTVIGSNAVATGDNRVVLGDNSVAAIYCGSESSAATVFASSFQTASAQAAFVASPYGVAAGETGELRFKELAAGGTNYVGFKGPDAITTNKIYTLPATAGSDNDVLTLTSATNGTLAWAAPGGGSPGGSGSELQYRAGASTFGAVTGSSVSGADITTTGYILPATGVGIGSTPSTSDLVSIIGNNNTRISIVVQNQSTSGNASFYFQNDRGGFASYGGLFHWGSASAVTFFGVASADLTGLITDGASSQGMVIGSYSVDKPVVIGTNNIARFTVSSAANISTVPVRLPGYAVLGLPAGTVGDMAYVTDALAPAPLAPVATGGAVTVPVFYDGTNWIVM